MSVLLSLALAMKLTVDLFPPPGKSELVMVNPLTPGILQVRKTVAWGVAHENSTGELSLTFLETGDSKNTFELVLVPACIEELSMRLKIRKFALN